MLTPEQFERDKRDLTEPHWVDVANGQLHVRTCGDGPLVLFLHGWTLDWRIWSPQFPLAQSMRLVMPDRRGFGRSTAPPQLTVERDDIDAMADHFGAKNFSLVGLSQGAAVALDYARTRPERIDAAVVIGAPLHNVVPELSDKPEIDRVAFSALVRAGRFAEMLAEWRRHPLTQVGEQAQVLLDQILADYDGRDQMVDQEALVFSNSDIASLTMPLLAIAGESDTLWRQKVAQVIASDVPRGIAEIIPEAGHVANLDQPQAINALLKKFLSRHTNKGY